MDLLENIRLLCKKNGISIDKLSKEAGFCSKLIYHWGETSPKLNNLLAVADYFEVSLDELIGRNIDKDKKILSEDDVELLCYYNQLNEQGKMALLATAQSFTTQGIYKKSNMVEVAK